LQYLDQINCFIYAKGKTDRIIHRNLIIELSEQGCPRRCGGIGDVLSGAIAAIISMQGDRAEIIPDDLIQCSLLGGKLVRLASRLVFEKKKRSMSALDVIENLSTAFEQIFE
jgi:ATP-dependent NAD(P)H-hydrate dehydratase